MLSRLIALLPGPLRNHLNLHPTFLSAAQNTSWLIAAEIIRLVVSLIVGVWIARYFGPEQYGVYSYALSFTGLFTIVIPLGLPSLVIRDLAREPERRNEILGSAFSLQFITSILVITLCVGIVLTRQEETPLAQQVILILSLGALLRPFSILSDWFQSQHKSVYTVISGISSLIFMAIVRVFLLVHSAPVQAFAVLLISEQAVDMFTRLYFYHRTGESIRLWRFDAKQAKSRLREAMPFLLTALAVTFYSRGSQVLLKELSGATAVGHYAAAARLAEIWYFVPSSIVASALPVLARAKKESEEAYLEKSVLVMRICIGIAFLSSIGVYILAPWIIQLIYGAEFAPAAQILRIYIWDGVGVAMAIAAGPWFLNEGLARISLQKTIVGLLIIYPLNYLLIPLYQGVGAALALLISTILIGQIWDFVDPRLRGLAMIKIRAVTPWRDKYR